MIKIVGTLLLLTGAVLTDLYSGRISNRLICSGLSFGCLVQIWESGIKGFAAVILQVFIPVILLYLLFLMRALGAGDIKLFSVIGSIWNMKVLYYCIIFSFFIGAVLSLCKLLYQKNLMARLSYFCRYIQMVFLTGKISVYDRQSDGKQNFIHFSIAILSGFCAAMGVCL